MCPPPRTPHHLDANTYTKLPEFRLRRCPGGLLDNTLLRDNLLEFAQRNSLLELATLSGACAELDLSAAADAGAGASASADEGAVAGTGVGAVAGAGDGLL